MRARYLIWGMLCCVLLQLRPFRSRSSELMPYPRHRLTYGLMAAGRYNAVGALLEPELRYRFRLHDSAAPLKREAHLGIALAPSFTPYVSRVGALLIVKPFAVLELEAGYFFNGWYGTLGHVQSFEHVEDEHYISDKPGEAKGPHESTIGHEVYLRLRLLAALGPFAFSNATSGIYTSQSLRGDAPLYYHAVLDILAPNNGWLLANDSDLVFISPFGLIVGVRFSAIHAFFRDEHFLDGKKHDNKATPILSFGPLATYTFYDHPESLLNKPTIIVMIQWWLRHPYRAGEEMGRQVPSIGLAFRMEGDLWSRD